MVKFWRVEPVDWLFFRDPRPFTAGVDVVGRLRFPPDAGPFLGALRSRVFKGLNRNNLTEADWKPIFGIRLVWLSLMKGDEPLIPAPVADGLKEVKNPLDLSVHSSSGEEYIKIAEEQKGTYVGLFSSRSFWGEDLWVEEPKVGIALEERTTKRGFFYRLTGVRLRKGVSFLVGAEIPDDSDNPYKVSDFLTESFVTPLGGEGKLARWTSWNRWIAETGGTASGRFLVLTPVPILDKSGSWVCEREGAGVGEILSAGLTYLSGWDMRAKRPKPGRRALAPGSVVRLGSGGSLKAVSVRAGMRRLYLADGYLVRAEDSKGDRWELRRAEGEGIARKVMFDNEKPLEPSPGILVGGVI